MSMIPQTTMFSWENEIENLGDNERLVKVLENLPDEALMQVLEKERGHGRDDYPVRAMWNMLLAMIVFGHGKFADIIREMKRNVQLRYICGFRDGKTPGADNVSRFVSKLMDHEEELLEIFLALSDELYEILPDFGESLAIDSKWVWSLANKKSNRKTPDGRSEVDAEWGIKEYSGIREDGSEWSSKKKCFGFKIHLICDVKYELPVAFIISTASGSDIKWCKCLLEKLKKTKPHIFEKCGHFMADKAYDDEELILILKELGIKSVIDKRDMQKNEKEKELPGSCGCRYYNEKGEVFCYSPEKGERHSMVSIGYDKERDAQRFKCPVKHYGTSCCESDTCNLPKTIRVPLDLDARIFTEVGRTTYMWKNIYNGRTSVERIFSRLDVSFGFEVRRVRGKKKMGLMALLGFSVINALATGSIKENKHELMRSLVRAA